jgi:hypothetical protein
MNNLSVFSRKPLFRRVRIANIGIIYWYLSSFGRYVIMILNTLWFG